MVRFSRTSHPNSASVPAWGRSSLLARSFPRERTDGAIRRGILRHCPTCDAYEVRDRRVAVLGSGKCRFQEVMLLRSYTCDLTVLSLGRQLEVADDERAELQAAGVELFDEPVAEFVPEAEGISALLAQSGRMMRFDTIYVALGLTGRSELAVRLGAEHVEDGMLPVDDHQRTVCRASTRWATWCRVLTQIGVAMGQAAIAANTINSSLERRLRPSRSRGTPG
jgi:thioredoxin reductase (NADPH)